MDFVVGKPLTCLAWRCLCVFRRALGGSRICEALLRDALAHRWRHAQTPGLLSVWVGERSAFGARVVVWFEMFPFCCQLTLCASLFRGHSAGLCAGLAWSWLWGVYPGCRPCHDGQRCGLEFGTLAMR